MIRGPANASRNCCSTWEAHGKASSTSSDCVTRTSASPSSEIASWTTSCQIKPERQHSRSPPKREQQAVDLGVIESRPSCVRSPCLLQGFTGLSAAEARTALSAGAVLPPVRAPAPTAAAGQRLESRRKLWSELCRTVAATTLAAVRDKRVTVIFQQVVGLMCAGRCHLSRRRFDSA